MTLSSVWQRSRSLCTGILIAVLGFPPSVPAQTHIVSPADLQKEIVASAHSRKHNTEIITGLLSSPRAEKALAYAGIVPVQVKTAVSALSDQELARLAASSAQAQADFAAGRLTDRDLIFILLGLAALILIIVAVR